MNSPEQDVRTFASRVQRVATLAGAAPETDSLAENAIELRGQANVLLQRRYERLIHTQLEAIRDNLHIVCQQMGDRVFGRRPYPKGVLETSSVLQALARELVATLDDKATSDSFHELSEQVAEEGRLWSKRRAIEQALSRFDDRAQACCWGTELCEEKFEPLRPEDNERTRFARLRPRLKEFAAWLVAERFLPLLAALGRAAPLLGAEVETLIQIDTSESPTPVQGKARKLMRDCMRQLAANVDDESLRRAVAMKLGTALAQDPDHVPPLFFLEYFEVIRGKVARQAEASIAALAQPKTEARAAPEPVAPPVPTPASAEPPPAGVAPDLEVRHADDFSSLHAGATTYHFATPLQRTVIAVLFAEWKKVGKVDGCGLTVAALAESIDEGRKTSRERLRVDKLFKGHPALGTILRKNGKSVWALYLQGPEKDQR